MKKSIYCPEVKYKCIPKSSITGKANAIAKTSYFKRKILERYMIKGVNVEMKQCLDVIKLVISVSKALKYRKL